MATPRGRPRSFDRDVALQRVMEIFWAKGYEGAQLNELTAAIGVTPPSFYAAFGSKEAAFREALDLYKATIGSFFLDCLDGEGTARDCIRAMLMAGVEVATSAPNSAGCMLMMGAKNCGSEHDPLSKLLIGIRQDNVARLQARLEHGREAGDVSPEADIAVLARFYGGMMQALSMQARDGMTREELEATLDPAMAALD